MRPRRGLPEPSTPDPELPESEETQAEQSAIRRGMLLDDDQEPIVPRRAARAAEEPERPDVEAIDLKPGATRAAPEEASAEAPAAATDQAPTVPQTAAVDQSATPPAAPPSRRGPGWARAGRVAADNRWQTIVAAAALGGIALSLGVGALPAQSAPLARTVPLVTAISRTCPVTDIEWSTLTAVSSEGEIRLREVGQTEFAVQTSPVLLTERTNPTVLAPSAPQASVVGGSLVYVDDQTWWGVCRSSLADQYVQLPGGAGAKLTIINPEPAEALVDVTLSGPEGEITGDGLRGITVPANGQHQIDLEPLAESVNAVGARVRSSAGRVSAVAQVSRDEGGDFATSTVQAKQLIITGIPAGASSVQLLLTNPGTNRNVIQLEGLGEGGRYDVAGFESYAVDAQRTISVDLTDALEGAPTALVITARDELAASAVVAVDDEFGVAPAVLDEQSVGRQQLVGAVAGAGTLQVANPNAGETLVVVDWGADQAPANRTVPAGAVVGIDIPAGADRAHIEATAPISAAVMLMGGDQPGFAIGVLQSAARQQASMPMQVDLTLGR